MSKNRRIFELINLTLLLKKFFSFISNNNPWKNKKHFLAYYIFNGKQFFSLLFYLGYIRYYKGIFGKQLAMELNCLIK